MQKKSVRKTSIEAATSQKGASCIETAILVASIAIASFLCIQVYSHSTRVVFAKIAYSLDGGGSESSIFIDQSHGGDCRDADGNVLPMSYCQ